MKSKAILGAAVVSAAITTPGVEHAQTATESCMSASSELICTPEPSQMPDTAEKHSAYRPAVTRPVTSVGGPVNITLGPQTGTLALGELQPGVSYTLG